MIAIAKHRLPVAVRPITRWDLNSVLAIERSCFVSPWHKRDFLNYIRNRCGFTAHCGRRVVGYLLYDKDELQKPHLHLVNCAVTPRYWRRGVGTKLLQEMKGMLASGSRTRITTPVRETDLRAQLFLRSQGFRLLTVRRRFFIQPVEDAYLLQYRSGGLIDTHAIMDRLSCIFSGGGTS